MIGGPARVLIVDDNADDLATYSRWLLACTERELDVRTAASIASALEVSTAWNPDCIVLDNDLRGATGLEFMAELAKLGFDVPIIAITGNGSEAIAVEFMKAGARDYLRKSSLSASDLTSAVVAQLSPHAMRRQLALYRERERSSNVALGIALKRVSFLAETGKVFAATRGYDELVRLAVTHPLPFLGEVCFLDLMESGVLYRGAVHVDGDLRLLQARDTLSMIAPGRDRSAAALRAIREDAALYLTGDALLAGARGDGDITALASAGLRAAVFLPLRFAGPVMGVLTLGTTRSAGFSDEERLLLDDYAQRVAVAIANARIVESERFQRERAETAKRRLTFQSRISTLFAQSLDWENALQKLMKIITTSFSDSAAIFAIERPQQGIRLVASASRNATLGRTIAQYYRDVPPLITDRVGIGLVARTGRSQLFSNELFEFSANALLRKRQQDLLDAWAPVSDICIPLQIKGAIVGVLNLVRDTSQKPFTTEDVAVAEDVARRTAIYMEIARLYESEHGIAAALQQALLPAVLPNVADVLFGVRYFAGAQGMDVGGDWYDIIEVDSKRMVITIGDVIGRGVKAAAAMGQYRDILRAYAFENFGPATALTRLNTMMNALGSEAFATCTLIVLDRHERRMRYASAGHPPAMLRLPDSTVRVLDRATSMPLGAWPETRYIEETLDMPVGATLVLYTDGLVETRLRSAADGVDVLRTALTRSSSNIELMLDGVLRDVTPDRSDDIAMLAVEMLPLQSETLKRWVFGRIDRLIMRTIRSEFEALLEAHAATPTDTYGARLILGELLANIVRHAPGPFRLELEWKAQYPELRLYDSGPGFAGREQFAVPQDSLSTTGRGLFLIAQTSRSFTMAPRPSGGVTTTVVLPVRRKSEERELALH